MKAFNDSFRCRPDEISHVDLEVAYDDSDLVRTTRIIRGGEVQRVSEPTPIRRS